MNHAIGLYRPRLSRLAAFSSTTVFAASLALSANVFGQAIPSTQETAQAAKEEVVTMEEYQVSTTIGSYHEETSSMASKVPTNLKELASSLSIMNATAIQDRNAVTLLDVFGYVTGATQSQGNINGFSFRGFPSTGSYTQNIQFDGLQGATLKKAATSAANVDSLEFLKGPNGVLYGQMNPGGLLNIVTKSPKEKMETNVRTTFGTYQGDFNRFGSKNTVEASVDTTGPVPNSKHMFYRLVVDASSMPSSRPGNFDSNLSIYPSFTYKWNKGTYLTIKAEDSQNYRRQDDGVIPIFTNGTAYGSTAYHYTAPLNTVYNDHTDWARDFGEALGTYFHARLPNDFVMRIQSRSVWHIDQVHEFTVNNANTFTPTATYATPSSSLIRQYNNVKNAHRYNYLDANIYRTFGPDKFKNTVIAGMGGGGEVFLNNRIAFGPNQPVTQAIALINPILDQAGGIYPADGTGVTNQVTYQTAFGQYVSDQMKIADKLHITLGLRHDLLQVHGSDQDKPTTTAFATKISPWTRQVGAVYDITQDISAYASWSQSVKPQTTIAFDINGNSSVPPESGEQREVGLKFETPSQNMNVSAAYYQITRSNVVVPSGTNFTVPTGIAQAGQAISRLDGEQQSKGFEVEAQYQPLPNWQLQGGIAYSKATITASLTNPQTIGMDLANAPRRTGNFWTRYNFPRGVLKGLGVGTGIIYVGQAWAGDPTTTVYYPLSGWVRMDSSVYYKWKRLDFALNVQNVLDRRYISAAQSALTLNIGEERKFTFSVGMKF